MSEHKDEKWLDEQLKRAVGGSTPVFDSQAWKHKYAKQYEALLARGGQPVGWGLGGPFVKLAIAAAVLVAAGVLLLGRHGAMPVQPVPGSRPAVRTSPAQMVSMISLSAAFESGGMEGLDKQCDRALERLGPRPNSISVQELLKDLNGKG